MRHPDGGPGQPGKRELDYAVVGIGINVEPPEGGYPRSWPPLPGRSIPRGGVPDGLRNRLAAGVLDHFYRQYRAPAQAHLADYRARSGVLGKAILVMDPGLGSAPARPRPRPWPSRMTRPAGRISGRNPTGIVQRRGEQPDCAAAGPDTPPAPGQPPIPPNFSVPPHPRTARTSAAAAAAAPLKAVVPPTRQRGWRFQGGPSPLGGGPGARSPLAGVRGQRPRRESATPSGYFCAPPPHPHNGLNHCSGCRRRATEGRCSTYAPARMAVPRGAIPPWRGSRGEESLAGVRGQRPPAPSQTAHSAHYRAPPHPPTHGNPVPRTPRPLIPRP